MSLPLSDVFHITVGLGIFFAAFFVSLPLLWLLRRYAENIRLVDKPGARKIHQRVMPVGGGVAIASATYVALVIAFVALPLLKKHLPGGGSSHLRQYFDKDMLCILTGALVMFVMGLIDDYRNLGAKTKLAVQIAVAVFLFWQDIRVTVFIDNAVFSFVVTVGWMVLITNAFNLLDNMDGLSAGVAFISGLIFVSASFTVGQWSTVLPLLALLGAILGFLCYNFPPATIFMGDSGALFIGYMMSALTIHATYYQENLPLFPVALPILVFAVPLFDTLTVAIYRWQHRRPLFQGDKNHFSHRLVRLGMSSKTAVLVIYLITFAGGITATLLYQVDWFGAVVILTQLLCLLMVIHLLEQTARNANGNGR